MGLRILIVEDSSAVAFTLRELLRHEHEVTLASSVSEAKAALGAATFDVVLSDDRLPDPAGVELLAFVKEHHPGAVRLLMSAWVDPARLMKAINTTGVFAFLEKPVTQEQLKSTLAQSTQMLGVIRERDEALRRLEAQKAALEEQVAERTRQLSDQNQRLERLAMRDPLTGLFNRRYIEQRMDEELARLKRYGVPFSVLLFDIDNFKAVNDTYGHGVGDQVLVAVARGLVSNVRSVDLVARFGGEEFLLLLPSTPDQASALTASRLCQQVAQLPGLEVNGQVLGPVTVSGGATQARADDSSWKAAVQRADEALYLAKHEGKNCSRWK
jgi:diguanylate cyclase (GGDEF)-like protein